MPHETSTKSLIGWSHGPVPVPAAAPCLRPWERRLVLMFEQIVGFSDPRMASWRETQKKTRAALGLG
jgi:hypothetical protein